MPIRTTLSLALACTLASAPADAQMIRRDHALHAAVGTAVYATARAFDQTPAQAVGWCALAGLAKEAYDATGRGRVEASDVVATVLPCLLMAAISGAQGRRASARRPEFPMPTRAFHVQRAELVAFQRTLR